jgi:hypothetical protein
VRGESNKNLAGMKERGKIFLLDAPLSPAGLFGDSVNTVIERFQEETKQAAVFQKLWPLLTHVSGRRPAPHNTGRRKSRASRFAVPHRQTGTRRSQAKSSKGKMDLRTVIVSKRASSKRKF